MAKEQEQPTLQKEIAGLLKEKEFVLHCIDITSTDEYFNKVNDMVLDVLMRIADAQKVDEEREQYKEMFRQHFNEIKLLRQLYGNLKGDVAKEELDPTEIELKCEWTICGKKYWNRCWSKGKGVLESLRNVSSMLNYTIKDDIDYQIEVINTKGEDVWQKWMETGVRPEMDHK